MQREQGIVAVHQQNLRKCGLDCFYGLRRAPNGKPIVETTTITTNTVEGYYSIFNRGMKGIYEHCSEKHLHRYLAEFDFRYSNRIALGVDDQDRADKTIKGMVGKRLTYRAADS